MMREYTYFNTYLEACGACQKGQHVYYRDEGWFCQTNKERFEDQMAVVGGRE